VALADYLGEFVQIAERTANKDAYRHLVYGVGRRIIFMHRSLRFVHALNLNERTEILQKDEGADLNIHLNSLYVHLRGILDNISWAIAYSQNLFAPLNEDLPACHRKVALFSKDFETQLKTIFPRTSAFVASSKAWHADLKALRDPVAHRVPLYAVPAFMTSSQNDDFQRYQQLVWKSLAAGDTDAAQNYANEANQIGTFEPVFTSNGSQDLHDIEGRIMFDLQKVTELLGAVSSDFSITSKPASAVKSP
jgi:hypothetical protein